MALRGARRALAMGVIGGAAAIQYLQRYEFTTDAAAPLGSPYTEGTGSLTLVQTDGQLSKSGGALVFPAQTTPAWGDQGLQGGAQTRAAGLAFFTSITFSTLGANGCFLGWNGGAGVNYTGLADGTGLWQSNATINALSASASLVLTGTLQTGVEYLIAHVLNANGHKIYIKGGAFIGWRLLWIGVGATASLIPSFGNNNSAGTMAHFRVRQLPAPFTSDTGTATFHIVAPVADTEYAGNADGLTDLTVTAPGSLDGADTTRCGFYYRTDADLSPAWDCYVDGLGRGRLDSIAADTTRTNHISVNSVIAGGATVSLRSVHVGQLHNFYTAASGVWTKRGGQIDVSLNDTVATIEPHIPAGWSAANLDDYPRTATAAQAAILDAT